MCMCAKLTSVNKWRIGGAETLWNKGGKAPPLSGAVGAVSSETEARGGPGRRGPHRKIQREIPDSCWEGTRNGIQGK